MLKPFKLILLFTLIFSFNSYSKNISEDILGFEDSPGLRKEIYDNFFDEGTEDLDWNKIEKLRELNLKRKQQIYDLLVTNYLNEGKPLETAQKKALEDEKIHALILVEKWFEVLKEEKDLIKRAYLVKNILRISASMKQSSSEPPLIQAFTGIKTWIGENYIIPLDDLKRTMPSNLVNREEGRYYKGEELREMIKKGEDISLIDPPNTSFWTKPEISISEMNPLHKMEIEGKIPNVFEFKKIITNDSKAKIKVVEIGKDGKKIDWKLKFGREVNTELVVSRLYNLVGYYSDQYHYVKNPKVYFKDEEHWKKAVQEWISFYDSEDNLPSNYIKEKGTDEKGFYVIFHEGLLEARSEKENRLGGFHLSYMGNWDRREVRAALLLNAFVTNVDFKEDRNNKTKLIDEEGQFKVIELTHDGGYSFGNLITPNLPNAFKWSFLKKKGNKIVFDYDRFTPMIKEKNPYQVLTYSDLKWMARYFVQITKNQLETISFNSGWPHEVARLFIEKMTKRRNEVVRVFGLEGEILDGKRIELWPEVDPKKFNLDGAIKDGKLVKDYKVQGTVNYVKFEYDILNFGGKTLGPVLNQVYRIVSSLPLDRIIGYPLGGQNSFSFDKKFVGVGIGIRFFRDITRNPDLTDDNKGWIVTDRLEIYGLVGGGIGIPIHAGLGSELEARGILGKEYIMVQYSPALRKAATQNLKRIFSLPFKKQKALQELKEGESFGHAFFVGFELEENLTVGPQTGRLAEFGIGLEQRKKYLNITKVEKKAEDKYEVTKANADEFTLTFKSFFELLSFLKISFFEAGIMVGKSSGKTFYFDLKNKELNYLEAFNQSAFSSKYGLAENLIPFATQNEKYFEKFWRMNFLSKIGTEAREEYKITVMPDNTIKRSFKYHTLHNRLNSFQNLEENHHVFAEMEFEDDEFEKITSRKLYLHYDVKDQRSTIKKMDKRNELINKMVAQNDFLKFDSNMFSVGHLGDTQTDLWMDFTNSAIDCMLEDIGCSKEGEESHKVDKFLSKIVRKKRTPIKAIKRLAEYIRRGIVKGKRIGSLIEFIGKEKVGVDFHLFGEDIPSERYIHLTRKPLI